MPLPTFTWKPTFPAKLSRKPGYNTVAYGDGYEQDSPKGINNNPEVWDLQFNAIDSATGQAIEAFLFTQNGQPFMWRNHKGELRAYKCRSSWDYSIDVNDVGNLTAQFTEYFGTTA